MHMANELLSPGVVVGSIAVATGALGIICHRAKRLVSSEKFALMGVMGAFVFAGQMVNFPLPFLPGTSGHIVGAVLLAIILGPSLAAIVLSSVVIVQCLIFQDGGLLAVGCNIINLAIVPTYLGYYVYRLLSPREAAGKRMYAAAIAASMVGLLAGALLVTVEVWLSGVLLVPAGTFMATMLGVHAVIGFIEGVITAAVVLYLRALRPELLGDSLGGIGGRKRAFYATVLAASLVIGAGLSLVASSKPDGLEWSYAERPDQPGFEPVVANDSAVAEAAEDLQSRYSPLPDYSIRADEAAVGWTSFAAVVGSGMTMGLIWLSGWAIRRKNGRGHASYAN